MLQRGLDGSKPLMGLSFWRSGIIAAETADGAVSLVGSERPPMECCSWPAPLAALYKIRRILRTSTDLSKHTPGAGNWTPGR